MRPTQQGESCADAFLAGVLERFQEMQVFFNPREESYERLGTFGAPASVSWADTGRGALLRRKADGRLELSAARRRRQSLPGLLPADLRRGRWGTAGPLPRRAGNRPAFGSHSGGGQGRCKESAFLQGLLPREILRAYTGR